MKSKIPDRYLCGVYFIKNVHPDGGNKIYIGSTQDFKGRLRHHVNNLRNGKHHNAYLQAAFEKYEEDSFEFTVVLVCDKKDLLENEQRFLDFYQPYKERGYNIEKIAGVAGYELRQETKQKISESNKKMVFTEEHRAKISKAMKGRKPADITYEKRKLAGYHISEEGRQKIAEAHKGNKHSLGKECSTETRRKISEANKGCIPWNKGTGMSKEEAKIRKRENLRRWRLRKKIEEANKEIVILDNHFEPTEECLQRIEKT